MFAHQLPGTKPLRLQGDLAAKMVAGIDRFLTRELQASPSRREAHWKRDLSSPAKYARSVKPNRERLARILGGVDAREPVEMQTVRPLGQSAYVGMGEGYKILSVRWVVLPGVEGEGLLLEPNGTPVAEVVALPDCDWTPESLTGMTPGVPSEGQFARRLAENGCRVLVPVLLDRDCTHSGIPQVRMTNQPHREFLYRAAYEMGRHVLGYEVQKVLAAVDWFKQSAGAQRRVGLAGYGEGGLVAFCAAALDTRVDAALISGYFGPRENLWREPIYRNVWALLDEFGDAEIASLLAPRPLTVEHCRHPEITGPPQAPDRVGAAPGAITTPSLAAVEREVQRARALMEGLTPPAQVSLVDATDTHPGSDRALATFLDSLGVGGSLQPNGSSPSPLDDLPDPAERLKRQFHQLLEHTQHLMREAEFTRARFWSKADASSVGSWQKSCRRYRKYLRDEVLGSLPPATLPANPRTRQVYDTPAFTGHEVVLDVYPDVFAYGILLLPKDLADGERRPVVVCQHGLEGRPQDVADPAGDNEAYHQFACKLAERGFVTYAPQNPYIGMDDFRVLQRKANPLKLSLFSFIVRQHERTLEWLASLPGVDPKRLAFYGLSYGGKTAMRVPALLENYCLSICSADYDEWIWKNVSARQPYSYLLSGEYEMPEFDLGNTFNYAEMSWLICPRPFMVERGHNDGVAPDEWVAYEYAKTRRRYDQLGLGDRTELEVFDGPHTINGVGTFAFLERMLGPVRMS